VGVEVNLFDFGGTLYHEHLKILFVKMIREERRFQDKETLIRQIREDVERAKAVLRAASSCPIHWAKN
jgi:riboflavin kinase/FMN adenylyltransferase